MIRYDEERRIFRLDTDNTSYVFGVYADGFLMQLYWGAKLHCDADFDQYISLQTKGLSPRDAGIGAWSTNVARMEYPTHGGADLRTPALECTFGDGTSVPQLKYVGYTVTDGKAGIEGMPAAYAEDGDRVQSLTVELVDRPQDLHVFLNYSVFEEYDVITRSVTVENRGEKCRLGAVMSASVDLPDGSDYDFLHLNGCWARERRPERHPVFCGTQYVDMKNGASGHYHNPFICFPEHSADENHGRVYSMGLVWSGEFQAGAQLDSYNTMRAFIGVNRFGFGYTLEHGEIFRSPEALLVYSDNGLGGMSRIWHKMIRERICRGKFRDIERYALINNWEATYFDFTPEKLIAIADKASELGLDMLVLDDGWFGKRVDEQSGLGDWFVNREKLPGGLDGLAKEINKRGLKFGLWFEPEMISPKNCELYEKHPDWALRIDGRETSLGRWQMTLDLSRKDVCDYIVESVSAILESANIEYVKWDMNRYMTEVGSALLPAERQCEIKYRYMTGLYGILETLTSRFPNVLFESCASGGGRFDMGMLHYMPQTWTSDDTDALCRCKIQYGTSLVFPPFAMGSHVSAVPNHQTGRITPIDTRANVAMSGCFGYELDLNRLPEEDLAQVEKQIARVKELRETLLYGQFHRLLSPFEGNDTAWMTVSPDKTEAVLMFTRAQALPNTYPPLVNLRGLAENKTYRIVETGETYGGDQLMNMGLSIPLPGGDGASVSYTLRAE